ncbi:UNVERIFIED_CONTAM: Potassium channel GORK [Sesamum radiatum]|uniref:Potassium channel GORK n=1 Tax=Sesamum radiatum TaxID=300843 RepID=A0AAW2VNL9_SESRA
MSSLLHHQRDGFDMQMIGNFLSFASRGDRVGLNEMLRQGMSPNVQDYDNRTALHLAASEGHASIVELLLAYNANVNLRDRWQRTVMKVLSFLFFPLLLAKNLKCKSSFCRNMFLLIVIVVLICKGLKP